MVQLRLFVEKLYEVLIIHPNPKLSADIINIVKNAVVLLILDQPPSISDA